MFDEPSVRRSRKLAQMCDDLQTASTGVIACKIMDVSTAKDVDPVTDGEDSPVVNEVCALTRSSPPSPPSHTNYPDTFRRWCHVHS